MTLGPDSLMNHYTSFFKSEDIDIELTSTALDEVAKTAKALGLGVRGLQTSLHAILEPFMFKEYTGTNAVERLTANDIKNKLTL